jgi:hypothetical protein
MLEDAARGDDAGASVAVKDIAELLADAVLAGPALQSHAKGDSVYAKTEV